MRPGLIDASPAARRAPVAVAAADVAALNASLDPEQTAFEVARVLLAAAGASSCGLWVDAGDVTPMAGVAAGDDELRIVEDFAERPPPESAALHDAFSEGRSSWTDDIALAPVPSSDAILLVPLGRDATTIAVAALTSVPGAGVAAVEGAAELAGAALANALAFGRQRAALAAAQRRVERLDVLHDLGGVLAERGGSKALVDRVNRLLCDRGLEVDSLAWRSRSVARRVGGSDLVPVERTMLRDGHGATTLADGRVAIAIRVGRKHVGSMRVRTASPPGEAELQFLELVAAGVGEVANRISLRAEVEEAARGTALAHERDRIAADLHGTAGQLFVAIRLLARREAEKFPRASEAAASYHRLADLADQGKWEIDHAVDALAFFPAARHGLAPAVRSLAATFHGGDLDVIVDVFGRPVRLPAPAERALYRVVHESLTNAQRHSRCSVVRVALSFERERVHLSITDDGTGLTETIPDRGRVGTSAMRAAVIDAGGTFHIRNARPRGAVVEAEIPRDRR